MQLPSELHPLRVGLVVVGFWGIPCSDRVFSFDILSTKCSCSSVTAYMMRNLCFLVVLTLYFCLTQFSMLVLQCFNFFAS